MSCAAPEAPAAVPAKRRPAKPVYRAAASRMHGRVVCLRPLDITGGDLTPNLRLYDLILFNHSGGKDSTIALHELYKLAASLGVAYRIVVLHNDLGRVEWPSTSDLDAQHADHYRRIYGRTLVEMYGERPSAKDVARAHAESLGLPFHVKTREGGDLLEQIEQYGKWPDASNRHCTSGQKRDPKQVFLTSLVARAGLDRPMRILDVNGERAEESTARARKPAFERNNRASNLTKRHVWTWRAIHDMTEQQVWAIHKEAGLAWHWAYDAGMSRLSCSLCVLASIADVTLGCMLRPDLAREYADLELKISHLFKAGRSITFYIDRADERARELTEARAAVEVPAPRPAPAPVLPIRPRRPVAPAILTRAAHPSRPQLSTAAPVTPPAELICDQERLEFYLGTHMPSWLLTAPRHVGLFIQTGRLRHRKTLPNTRELEFRRHVAIDSGAFTEVSRNGRHTTPPQQYIDDLMRYDEEIGDLDWAAPQDHMCEPAVLAVTGLTIERHLQLTVENFAVLEQLWCGPGDCPVMPVIQGWTLEHYLRCMALYAANGINLWDYPVVGVGSVCRRQNTEEIGEIFRVLAERDLPLHGFGVKSEGIRRYGRYLTTADSLAWSVGGRRTPTACGSTTHASEANCMTYALSWLDRVLSTVPEKAAATPSTAPPVEVPAEPAPLPKEVSGVPDPPQPMTGDQAAWIRANVWTPLMRKQHKDTPRAALACACEFGRTHWCGKGDHERCHRAEPLNSYETAICGRGGVSPTRFPQEYTHPSHVSATGPRRESLAMVWLADRTCRWVCPCVCHAMSAIPAAQEVLW